MGAGTDLLKGASKGLLNQFVEIPKGKKVAIKIWYNHNSLERPGKIYDEKIVGYLRDEYSYEVGSEFDTPFEKANSAILNTIVSKVSDNKISLINKYNNFKMFKGGTPISLNLTLDFQTRYDSYMDVQSPINILEQVSLPFEGAAGLLQSSTPNFFHVADKLAGSLTSADNEGVISFVSKLVKKGTKVASNNFTYIELIIGDHLIYSPVIIEKVKPTFSTERGASRSEVAAKLIDMVIQAVRIPESKGVFLQKLSELALNVPIFNVSADNFSPSRRYPINGKVDLTISTMWAHTQDDAKRTMGVKSSTDNAKNQFTNRVMSLAQKLEKQIDKAIEAVNSPALDEKGKRAARAILISTLGDLVAGGSV